jgi:hypothetical protein
MKRRAHPDGAVFPDEYPPAPAPNREVDKAGSAKPDSAALSITAEEWLKENDPDYETVSRQGWTDSEGRKSGGWRQLKRGRGDYRSPRERETLQGLAGLPGSQPWTPSSGDDPGDGRTYDFRSTVDLCGRRYNSYAPGTKNGRCRARKDPYGFGGRSRGRTGQHMPRYNHESALPSLMEWLGFERAHSRAPWLPIVKPKPLWIDSAQHRRNLDTMHEKLTNRALRSYMRAPLDTRNGSRKEHTRALRRASHNGIADSIWVAHLEGVPQWRIADTHKVSERTVRYVITRKEQMQNDVLLAVREEGKKTRDRLEEVFTFMLALRGETPGEAAERILEEEGEE